MHQNQQIFSAIANILNDTEIRRSSSSANPKSLSVPVYLRHKMFGSKELIQLNSCHSNIAIERTGLQHRFPHVVLLYDYAIPSDPALYKVTDHNGKTPQNLHYC